MLGQTGEYLTFSDQTLTLKPQLATSWKSNSTADVWTFEIRQGVKFHNGQTLTADDVVYTYQLQTNPKGTANALSAFGGVLTPDGVKKTGPYTVEFHLSGAERELPVPDLVRQLQHDHPAQGLRPGEVAEHVRRHRPVRAEELHHQSGARRSRPTRTTGGRSPSRRARTSPSTPPRPRRSAPWSAAPSTSSASSRSPAASSCCPAATTSSSSSPARTVSCRCATTWRRSPTRGSGRRSRSP